MRYFNDTEVLKLRKALKSDPDVKSIRALSRVTGIDYWRLITDAARKCIPDLYREIERRKPQVIKTEATAQMALRMKLETNASWGEIAEILDCKRQHVQKMAKDLDTEGRLRKLEASRRAEREALKRRARVLKNEGVATRLIALELGQSTSTINRWVCHA